MWYIICRSIRELTKTRLIAAGLEKMAEPDKATSKDEMIAANMRAALEKASESKRAGLEAKLADVEARIAKTKESAAEEGLGFFSAFAKELSAKLPSMWEFKFDFLRPDVQGYDEIKGMFVQRARDFLTWFAPKLDAGEYPADTSQLSARFPLIWDAFVAEGYSDDFFNGCESHCGGAQGHFS